MPPKAKIAAPIDRPLSKAYVRQFTGWSTAEPPGVADPTSFRIMENVLIGRDGAARIRPGLRYLSYAMSPSTEGGVFTPGLASDRPLVGSHEAFYLNDGTKAYLGAVREADGTVGFRVWVIDTNGSAIYTLTDPLVDFEILHPEAELNFSEGTTYVKYLQIDNKVFALSDNGENMRLFRVGSEKTARTLQAITKPGWDVDTKLDVRHPEAAWIEDGIPTGTRRNRVHNPSFETNLNYWTAGRYTDADRLEPGFAAVAGNRMVRLGSLPARTNVIEAPLHNVAVTGVAGWVADDAPTTVTASTSWMRVGTGNAKDRYWARSGILTGIKRREKYRLALDFNDGAHFKPLARVKFLGSTGDVVGEVIDLEISDGPRWVSPRFTAPKGAVSVRVLLGGENTQTGATHVDFKNVVLCPGDEATDIFTGDSGANYFWLGDANASASVYHPPQDLSWTCDKVTIPPGDPLSVSIHVRAATTGRAATLKAKTYNKNDTLLETLASAPVADVVGAATRIDVGDAAVSDNAVAARMTLEWSAVPRGEYHWVDAAMIETASAVVDTYFDGSTTDTPEQQHSWADGRHESRSIRETFAFGATVPAAETKTDKTLIATGGTGANDYAFGFFYTFNNEVGESAPSKVTEIRAKRAWADWRWETPNAAGEPSGNETRNPDLSADQLVAIMPADVFKEAVAQGAISWNLYMVTWSEQDPAPVTALQVGVRELPDDATYQRHGWIRVTPQVADITEDSPLPTADNRYNYSDPSRGGQGLIAADRMVMVNDPTDAAVIRYSSNRLGEYTNFTARKGGGYKTLTSGNLFVPACVKLWQNPQSADTITILCMGTDGHSTAYYMAPAQIASQSEAINVMGFEETTATSGTTSPYGVEVFNNSLYHPVEDQLVKSTASNYNINHKSMTDMIRDMWEKLADKYWIISSQHDGRLYFIVNNPSGELLEEGCKGNEIWVFDGTAKTGTWSRFLIQAASLRKIEYGGQVYMSVVRPDGLFFLDPEYGLDDVVDPTTLVVSSQGIPWKLESNTQGANRAHDAWCHLQQLSVQLGYFQGRMRYGIRSVDVHGKAVDISKIVKDTDPPDALPFDIEDNLRIARDLREWFFYAESVETAGVVEPSYGQINLVQFRYTPVTVNVGYDYGSVETFEYGRDAALAASTTTDSGIPLPRLDSRRP